MSNIKIFENEKFGQIRTAGTSEHPLFCLSDICKILELQVSKVKIRLNERGVTSIPTPTHNQFGTEVIQEMVYVNEQNLYKVIMRSDKPQAEAFQDWVCGEVLPSIRKNGAYMTEQTIERALAEPDFLIQLATQLKEERNKRLLAEQKATEAHNIMIENQPKISFANAILSSKTSILIGELAKILTQNGYKIGERRLFQWMRNNHYLGSIGDRYNIPNQEYVEMGLFDIKQSVRTINDRVITIRTTKITPKGQQYFINKLCKMKQMIF